MIFLGVFFIFLTSSVKSENCGKIFTQSQFILTSENYPQPYPNDKVCFYLLKGNDNCTKEFRIEFLDFDLAKTAGCVKDRLEIGSQDALCGTKNGSKVYSSESGLLKLKFVSDEHDEERRGRGFRLFVTRIDYDFCKVVNTNSNNNNEFTVNKVNTTYLPPVSSPCCLNNIFTSKTFLLISPNFPYSINQAKNCTFIIRKFSSSVCRLRIKILFFNLGSVIGKTCPYGYLEIDGKLICGCNSDLQLTTDFYRENKFIKFYSGGFGIEGASGFALEVVQDECQKRYEPEGAIEKITRNKFRFYNDQKNRIQYPNIDQLKLIREKSYYSTNANKHVYFFAPEDDNNSDETLWTQEKEETTNNIDISSNSNNILTNQNRKCFTWNNDQLAHLQKRFGQSLTQMCKFVQESNENCIILRNLAGNLQSPGYPATYPANRNVCFRFPLSPGYCSIKMYFEQFDIERSYDCLKDYLSIDQYRYCGNYLMNRQVTINPYKSLIFMSDANYCGKGFSALYQQVRCQTLDNNKSIGPSINCNPDGGSTGSGKSADSDNIIPTTVIPAVACDKVFADKYFIIRNELGGANFCFYDVRRHDKNICKLRLNFDQFNIPCHLASIIINGRVFCGQKSGQSVVVPMLENVSIVYKNNGQYFGPNALFIRGEQTDTECDAIPEAARIVSREMYNPTQTETSFYKSVN